MLVDTVCFLFQPNNVQVLSWGTKWLQQQNGTNVDFPSIKPQRCRLHRFSDYDKKHKVNPLFLGEARVKPLGRKKFTKTVTALNRGEQHRTNCVHYAIGVLLFDNLASLMSTVQNEVAEPDKPKVSINDHWCSPRIPLI